LIILIAAIGLLFNVHKLARLLVFTKLLANILRSPFGNKCVTTTVIWTFCLAFLQLRHLYHMNNREIIVRDFVNTTNDVWFKIALPQWYAKLYANIPLYSKDAAA